MSNFYDTPFGTRHEHVFLGGGHERNEQRTWAVITLCSVMMIVEIVGGGLFGSLALVADGMHMSTHAGAMLIAALAYTYARKHANDSRFVFGTGKLGDLAGFSSAIILGVIALMIGYEAVVRLLTPVPIHFSEAIPIAILGLLVNVASAWLLSGDEENHHGHSHGHSGDSQHAHHEHGHTDSEEHSHEHDNHGVDTRDHNMRAAYFHIIADAAVSILVIFGLLLAKSFGWLWMDPVAGIMGALVIANWSYGLIRDTGAILVDFSSDNRMASGIRAAIEASGDKLVDLHVWRLGPGHFGVVISVVTEVSQRGPSFYYSVLRELKGLSHISVEVHSKDLL